MTQPPGLDAYTSTANPAANPAYAQAGPLAGAANAPEQPPAPTPGPSVAAPVPAAGTIVAHSRHDVNGWPSQALGIVVGVQDTLLGDVVVERVALVCALGEPTRIPLDALTT
ncbi:MAG TPA: hypothetical protein PLB86_07285 [Dermatophilaceae bacterium]|nr:hypothetical protein [Dermatophilaceae bacterium]